MRPLLCLLWIGLAVSPAFAQKKQDLPKPVQRPAVQPAKKYPSLLWEITGNGLKQPSYLFGTMHVSNKLAFHLGDSFYHAIRSVDVVALEQDPDLWQEEYSKQPAYDNYDLYNIFRRFAPTPSDRLSINTFNLKDYREKLKAAFALEAKLVNGMMYRRSPVMEDFQEDTYLDMYIYQAGKKLNKIVTGVENYKETNKLVKEAYKALLKDQYSKRKSYEYRNYLIEGKKREEAYRSGNLDLIDSLEQMSISSDEFQEKFMYKRNEIQVHSIDTILRNHSLFVAVGAAHLPGTRGVIELLRKKGYRLRPIIMGERNGKEKENLEKTRVPVVFKQHWMEDSVFSIATPGDKLFRYPSYDGLNMIQYADMANGSYYMITRLRTNAAFLGHSQQLILKKIDSLLYENIPGKILTKKTISVQGYPGVDITNRTKKGNVQRYNVIVLPDEILVLKIAGLNNYVLDGKEAEQFLSSVSLRKKQGHLPVYEPPYKGFSVNFPKAPSFISAVRNNYKRDEWSSVDDNGNAYVIIKANLHQYDFIEEDTFDLGLMEESFTYSGLTTKATQRHFSVYSGYPCLDAAYEHTDGSHIKAKYIIRGNDYYLIAAKYKDDANIEPFFRSFKFNIYNYPVAKLQKDSSLGFSVMSPFFYEQKKTDDEDDEMDMLSSYRLLQEEDEFNLLKEANETYAYKTVGNDTTGEHIAIIRYRVPQFYYTKDTLDFFKEEFRSLITDPDFIVHKKEESLNDKNWQVLTYELRDTGSSRTIIGRNFYKAGTVFRLLHMTDTLSRPGSFVKTFFDTFEPADTLKPRDPFTKKSTEFFNDYFGEDSLKAKRVRYLLSSATFDSADLPQIKKAIQGLNWKTKRYLQLKQEWIGVLGTFSDSITVNYLAELYAQAKDTTDLQNTILNAILNCKTAYAFNTFKELLLKEPPAILENNNYSFSRQRTDYIRVVSPRFNFSRSYNPDENWQALYDTLQLTGKIIPELINLMTIEDYKPIIMQLLITAVDSGYLKGEAYKTYLSKFLLEAKQFLKKQFAEESKAAIDKVSRKDNKNYPSYYYENDEDEELGNEDLVNYCILLTPFWDNAEVKNFFEKLMSTSDKTLLFDAALLLLRNGKPVHDSIITLLASKDNYRIRLYNALQEAKLLDKFPSRYKNQSDISRAMLKSRFAVDSLEFLQKELVTDKGQKGWVYFYRYKKMKDDDKWKIAVSGIQPYEEEKLKTSTSINRNYGYRYDEDDEVFNDLTDEVITDKPNLAAAFARIIKENLYGKRESSRRFYRDKENNLYDVYLTDRVRANRYD